MYIGIDLGGTNIAAGVVTEEGKIISKASVKTGADRPYPEIIRDMAELAKRVTADAGLKEEDIRWVGVGSPGTCDCDRGVLIYANNLGFYNTPMRAEFQKHFNVPFYIANDADCAAYGEAMAGAAKGTNSSITITLGTGVGGGVIVDGKIMTGFNKAGGELGHMVISVDGEDCTCGKHGCWESYASATALVRQTRVAMVAHPESAMWQEADGSLDNVTGRTSFNAAKKGDFRAQMVVDRYLHYVSVGLLNIITIFQPERLLIGGGISNEGDTILGPIRDYVKRYDYCKTDEHTYVCRAALGNDAGIIGAAFLGVQYAGK